jgi:CheY-like chemotaxis protein
MLLCSWPRSFGECKGECHAAAWLLQLIPHPLRDVRLEAAKADGRRRELSLPATPPAQKCEPTRLEMLVLIVEDNEDQADSLAMVLRLWGFETEVAADGPTALEMASRDKPDAILTDLGLPGAMSGFELAERLGEKPELKGVPIAAVTAYTDEESRKKSKAVGLVEHFGKPADLAALHRLLDDRRDALLRRIAFPNQN